jgi:sulfoxide reductase heme-binding subunit YedZ
VKPKNTRYLVLIAAVSLLVVAILVGLDPLQEQESWLAWLVRGAALLGYWAVFLSILSSAYLRELIRFFGRPFVKVHHFASVAGLALIALHPVAVAVNSSSLAVFVPRFDSLIVFLTLGGRLALYLIGIAALAALLRANLKRYWRVLHYLNYIAFFLASIHASLIGTTFRGQGARAIILKVVAAVLSLVAVYVFARKQMGRRRRRR